MIGGIITYICEEIYKPVLQTSVVFIEFVLGKLLFASVLKRFGWDYSVIQKKMI